ncbi:hypothetical protein [Arthrospira platensis]|uniref:hypothetical protein n=1 Tax=Limnospira TaxID=2596745 RepID=UPI000291E2F7|nr:hypothetical protein [Arthrospira platensis]MDF2207371.1 hypothetical protein [Arthrospira platensis NCB002]MDT9183155.1 hypothetical protein [Limnospira sp. PMC 289.06]MDT9296058.1 hypothetical protein [Arthrospira platensis PCC 7345]MDT9310857.1 hypothetical protein [Limnospira sp. Paracas R14]QQW28578.2 hypothetical protein AP9108_27145 [Arthrospira sp. PCC 9108]
MLRSILDPDRGHRLLYTQNEPIETTIVLYEPLTAIDSASLKYEGGVITDKPTVNDESNNESLIDKANAEGNHAVYQAALVSLVWGLAGLNRDSNSDKYEESKSKMHVNIDPLKES